MTVNDLPKNPTPQEIAEMPIDRLKALIDEAVITKKKAEAAIKLLSEAVVAKYPKLNINGSGTAKDTDGDFEIKVVVPKNVSWSQEKLEAMREKLGDEADEYIDTKTTHKISETKYNAWPQKVKDKFEPARTFKVGKPKLTIERKVD